MVLEKLAKSQVTIRDGDKLSKHQELCCGCIYDDPNEEEIYCLNCFECEFKQGEMEEPSGYQEKPEKLFKLFEKKYNFFKKSIAIRKNVRYTRFCCGIDSYET